MPSDEFKKLADVLNFLRNNQNRAFLSEEISEHTKLPLNEVKAIVDNARINHWVDDEHYADDGTPTVKINYDGNKKWSQLTDNAKAFSTPNPVTHISIHGNANFGDGNIINSDNSNIVNSDNSRTPENSHTSIWTKWSVIIPIIIGGLTIAVMIIIFLASSPQTIVEDMPSKSEDKIVKSQLSLKLKFISDNNSTQMLMFLSNAQNVGAKNVKITLNPMQKIMNYTPIYHIDPISLNLNGDRSLLGEMERISTCSMVVISVFTDKKLEDNDYGIHVTSDNFDTINYLTKTDGKIRMLRTDNIPLNPCN